MSNLATELIAAGQNKEYEKLHEIVEKCDAKTLISAMKERMGRAEAVVFWNYFLSGCQWNNDTASNKQFTVIAAVLNQLNQKEINSKQVFDLITRLFIELPKLTGGQLIELSEYCIDSLRMGDIKCTGWRELLPEVMKNINALPKIVVHGVCKSGSEYRSQCIQNILSIKWPETSLTNIASMFRDMPITKEEKISILNKLCENIKKLEPTELPALTYQLLALCTSAALIVIPLSSLNEYFHRNYYKPKFIEMGSDQTNFDSIENYSEKEVWEAQDTIYYHLSNFTEHKINEKDIVQEFRAQKANPRFILTPFLINALLAMDNVNRYFDSTRVSTSPILLFLRHVIQNNEQEREMYDSSNWCQTALGREPIDLTNTFTVLIDHSKDSTDIVTPGLIGLAITLLKAPNNSNLNAKGINLLDKFVRKRELFELGIVDKLIELLVAEQDSNQYAECLAKLSKSGTITADSCFNSIKGVLDFFLLIPGHHAMRMMTFISPLARKHPQVRDYLIDTLKKAMYQSELSTRQLGVSGFCKILSHVKSSNAHRPTAGAHGTQPSISGYSLFSQQTYGTAMNNGQQHFDYLVLEIIGILRKCFNQTHEIKETLYEKLLPSMELNPNITPHVLQFLDWHFRNYFDVSSGCSIKFNKCVREQVVDGNSTVQVYDQIGKLLQFMCQAVLICDHNAVEYDTSDLKEFLGILLERIDLITVQRLGLGAVLSEELRQICGQYLNCLEALMSYVIHSKKGDEDSLDDIFRLFNHHAECTQATKDACSKKTHKKKPEAETSQQSKAPMAVVNFKPENIWSLETLYEFLSILLQAPINGFDSKADLARYVLFEIACKVEQMRTKPNYEQIKFSQSNYEALCKITKILFKKFSHHLNMLVTKFDSASALFSIDCLRQCLFTAKHLYNRKFKDFLIKTDGLQMAIELQNIFDDFIRDHPNQIDDINLHQIPVRLLHCLDVVFEFIPAAESVDSYNWVLQICTQQDIEKYDIQFIYNILFNQWMKTQSGFFFECVAMQIEDIAGRIEPTEKEVELPETVISISKETAKLCSTSLCEALLKQIQHAEYFILKVRSLYAKWNIGGQDEQVRKNCSQLMKTMERAICLQLITISKACIHLTDTALPLGKCMDTLIRTLTKLYVCLANLTKHFIHRHGTLPVSYNHTKFEKLIRTVGKTLPLSIYTLIPFIEGNILHDDQPAPNRRRRNPKTDKAQVNRHTRFIPKLIKSIEDFNKFIISLGKKTKHDLSKLLHIGTVRDFRIKTDELRNLIDQTLRESEMEDMRDMDEIDNSSEDGNDENEDEDGSASDMLTNGTNEDHAPNDPSSSSSPALSRDVILDENDDEELNDVAALKNVEAINRRAAKRKQRVLEDDAGEGTSTGRTKRNRRQLPSRD